jgi:hypothetical protein
MDRRSNIIFIAVTTVTGVSLIVFSQAQFFIGIALLGFVAVWAILTLPKWGLLRRRWDRIPATFFSVEDWGDHQFGSPCEDGFAPAIRGESLMLRIMVGFRTMPDTVVESLRLEVMGKRLPSNWVSREVIDREAEYVYFAVPNWVKAKEHKVKLIAFVNGKEQYSNDIVINFPEQQKSG